MADNDIYRDIARRTGGDIYIGVVGAVRTGKSTFIRRFTELLVLPSITDEYDKGRITDELPQSGSGRSVMTTQPHFVPNEAVKIPMSDAALSPNIRMVDCVGYMIDGALGQSEGDALRMVHTPWSDEEMPFEQAAELGTYKVMTEHSTIGVLVTTDGSICDLPREAYESAEERVAQVMREQNKPFLIVLNTTSPGSDSTLALRDRLEEKYGVTTVVLDIMNMTAEDCRTLIESLLMEFPIRTVNIEVPAWLSALGIEHKICTELRDCISNALCGVTRMRDYSLLCSGLHADRFSDAFVKEIDCGSGNITLSLQPDEKLFYEVLSDECGFEIEDDYHLISTLRDFAVAKEAYDRLSGALEEAERTGYGLVPPAMNEMTLEQPEIVKQGARYGVKLRANASGLHLIKVNVDSEIAPLVGSEEQSAELVEYLLDTIRNSPDMIWQTNIFGKSLYDLVCNGMMGKINSLPDDVRVKLREAVQRIVNEGCNNLICVML
ncbi:MAG: stage IV sporulation protein A [Clostridia bacterium]|nr:stage IV sporulation protein A [Clostridia bacterium]